uniref:Uncharacterized protein n=1 Tax=Arcella intermedia TaxID=1963864 RepID=A0A6B2L0X3_9EUKA
MEKKEFTNNLPNKTNSAPIITYQVPSFSKSPEPPLLDLPLARPPADPHLPPPPTDPDPNPPHFILNSPLSLETYTKKSDSFGTALVANDLLRSIMSQNQSMRSRITSLERELLYLKEGLEERDAHNQQLEAQLLSAQKQVNEYQHYLGEASAPSKAGLKAQDDPLPALYPPRGLYAHPSQGSQKQPSFPEQPETLFPDDYDSDYPHYDRDVDRKPLPLPSHLEGPPRQNSYMESRHSPSDSQRLLIEHQQQRIASLRQQLPQRESQMDSYRPPSQSQPPSQPPHPKQEPQRPPNRSLSLSLSNQPEPYYQNHLNGIYNNQDLENDGYSEEDSHDYHSHNNKTLNNMSNNNMSNNNMSNSMNGNMNGNSGSGMMSGSGNGNSGSGGPFHGFHQQGYPDPSSKSFSSLQRRRYSLPFVKSSQYQAHQQYSDYT